MSTLIAQLEAQSILNLEQIERLRNYITEKYPNDKLSRAQILADAVHQILSRYLSCLDTPLRLYVQNRVIKQAVVRKSFYVNGHDLFDNLIHAGSHTDEDFEILKSWIAHIYHYITNAKSGSSNTWSISLDDAFQELNRIFNPSPKYDSDFFQQLTLEPALIDTRALPVPQRNLNHFLKDWAVLIGISLLAIYLAQKTPLPTTNTNNPEQPLNILEATTVQPISLDSHLDALADFMRMVEPLKTSELLTTKAVNVPLITPTAAKTPTVTKTLTATKTLTTNKTHSITELNYRSVNIKQLSSWLKKKNALLGEMSYLKVIVSTAKKYNIDPILLIAITGQEQSFVPQKHPEARTMANNPFNVFGSWRKYNTTLSDSTDIACRTLLRLSKDCPDNVDPVKWINRRYASDPHWWASVRRIMRQIESTSGMFDTP